MTNGGWSRLALKSSEGARHTNSRQSIGLGVSSSGPVVTNKQTNKQQNPDNWSTVWVRVG